MAIPVLGVVHVNVNCSDLGRSLRFYRDLVGLAPLTHTNPLPQDGAGFGLPGRVQWDAHLLHDARGPLGPARGPARVEAAAPRGQARRRAEPARPVPPLPLGARRGRGLREARGGRRALPLGAGHRADRPRGRALRALLLRARPRRHGDRVPRGARRAAGAPPAPRERELLRPRALRRLVPRACSGSRRSAARRRAPWTAPASAGTARASGRPSSWPRRAQPSRSSIDLLEWKSPRPCGAPARDANQLGLFRLAFLVEDAAACHAELLRHGVETSAPVWLEMGPEVPIAGLWAVFFRDPDGTCLELIQRPELRPGA